MGGPPDFQQTIHPLPEPRRFPPTPPVTPDTCEWTVDRGEEEYATACGHTTWFLTGAMKFCPFCGRPRKLAD